MTCKHTRKDWMGFCVRCGEQVEAPIQKKEGWGLKKDGISRGKFNEKKLISKV